MKTKEEKIINLARRLEDEDESWNLTNFIGDLAMFDGEIHPERMTISELVDILSDLDFKNITWRQEQ